MPVDDAKSQPALGFLTVLEHAQHGLMGGYLVLNSAGRPLEFHCTAPIKPNRAQQILYGPTLEPYLYGEQIGQALVAKSPAQPLVICTDLRPALALRPLVSAPVALVLPENDGARGEPSPVPPLAAAATIAAAPGDDDGLRTPRLRIDSAHSGWPQLQIFQIGRNRLAVPPDRDADRSTILKRLAPFEDLFDLAEPFSRIREALEEAQRGGR
ncbi:MAG TPA: hypothetical protein VGY55_04530 [Pirellulales bacterium]|jgi:hypothetical protein|nr:hypothetical protein [Pirellulales bacterium]